jgi:ribonuclease-3
MPSPQWSELEQVLGHVFGKRRRLEQALTHSSLAYERATGRGETSSSFSAARKSEARIASVDLREDAEDQDNEQLEFLGDAVLGLIVADCLFRTYPEMNEGDLTRLRAQLVSRRHLGQVGARISLGDYMRLGRGEERSGGRQKAVLLANALEAVIAALYLDGGLKVATHFVTQRIVEPYLDDLHSALEAGQAMGDHKSALQEWLQAHKSGSPHYTVKAESGPDHRKRFLVEVQILGENGGPGAVGIVAEGAGSTKKKAEQEAARLAYAALVEASAAEAVPQHIDPTRWAGKVS